MRVYPARDLPVISSIASRMERQCPHAVQEWGWEMTDTAEDEALAALKELQETVKNTVESDMVDYGPLKTIDVIGKIRSDMRHEKGPFFITTKVHVEHLIHIAKDNMITKSSGCVWCYLGFTEEEDRRSHNCKLGELSQNEDMA